jgi:aspartate aminotransferase
MAAPDGSIILFHVCAHNPSGCDPSIEEWKKIIRLVSTKGHVAFFDSAYQGFATGDAEVDAEPLRYAVSMAVPIVLAQSFAKNFGLYGERVGTLSVVCSGEDQRARILSILRNIFRPIYSSPPRHGSSIVKTILSDDELKCQYMHECKQMSYRIQAMRAMLVRTLEEVGSTHDWSHILKQIGMFSYTGLTAPMCEQLTQDYSIFLTKNGRVSVAGLNEGNIRYVAEAIHAVSHAKNIRRTNE